MKGAVFLPHSIELNDAIVKFDIWDTAGSKIHINKNSDIIMKDKKGLDHWLLCIIKVQRLLLWFMTSQFM